ncbi:uncharacterized protein LOC143043466 [Mytilus galloprovincialis]|uniref:uncharacterized protein LOC143043466 n=1 Tax=Mytilus galloprovincialis TaxID=29158 RepID=UPI003F7CBB55
MSLCTFLLILISGSIHCYWCSSMGYCQEVKSTVSNNRKFYFLEEFCCDNFQKHEDGNCHACSEGFTSKAGHACTPCLKNTFGTRCAENCHCDQSERCDHVHGCVPTHYSDTLFTGGKFTMMNTTYSYSNSFQTTTFHQTTDIRPTGPNNEQFSGTWTSPKSTLKDKNNGFINQTVLIYMFMAVAGALVVLIGLCLCLICVCWKRHVSSKKREIIASSPAVPLPDIQETVSDSQGTSGYGYEVIDESKLEREKPVIQHDYASCKSSNDDSEVCGTDSDGYLHPYHSLVSNNSISIKSVHAKSNENIYEDKLYIELSAEKQWKNEEQH